MVRLTERLLHWVSIDEFATAVYKTGLGGTGGPVLFVHRRGQGLSGSEAPYIMDQVDEMSRLRGDAEARTLLATLLETEQLDDQLAAFEWLKKQVFVRPDRIAAQGNSFGGIQTVLGAARVPYCAAVDASGGAQSWADAPEIRALMREAVRKSNAPVFFFQAENDFDLSPSFELSEWMRAAKRLSELKIYPAFGGTAAEGHSFAYLGEQIWGEDVMEFLNRSCSE